MKVCCVVVTYNRKELLGECIDALKNQTYNLANIIVIDNNSTDGTDTYLRVLGYMDSISYIKLDSNIGGAGGFNRGIKRSLNNDYDWVWIMDDDTIPKKDALENLLSSLNKIKGQKVGFICSKVLGLNNEEMNIPNISKRLDQNGYPIWMKYLNDNIVEVESATFVSILLNSNAIKKVGLPWEKFFIWGDDIEYTLRISKNFAPGYVTGTSIAIHKRANPKNLSIIEEDNINRLNMYKYKFRNDIIISKNYNSRLVYLKNIFSSIVYGVKVAKESRKYKLKKLFIIYKSTFNGILNLKLQKDFIKRIPE